MEFFSQLKFILCKTALGSNCIIGILNILQIVFFPHKKGRLAQSFLITFGFFLTKKEDPDAALSGWPTVRGFLTKLLIDQYFHTKKYISLLSKKRFPVVSKKYHIKLFTDL